MDKNDDIYFDDLLGDLGLSDDSMTKRAHEDHAVHHSSAIGLSNKDNKKEKSIIDNDVSTDDTFEFANYVPSTSQRGINRRRQIPGIETDSDKPIQDVNIDLKTTIPEGQKPKSRWNIDKSNRRTSLSFDLDLNESKNQTKPTTDPFDDTFSWLNNSTTKIDVKKEVVVANLKQEQTNDKKNATPLPSETRNETDKQNKFNELKLSNAFNDSITTLQTLMQVEIKTLRDELRQRLDQINSDISTKISNDCLEIRNQAQVMKDEFIIKLKNCSDKMEHFQNKWENKLEEIKQNQSASENVTKEECAKLTDFIQRENKSNENYPQYKTELERQVEKLKRKQRDYRDEILRKIEKKDDHTHAVSSDLMNKEWLRLNEERKSLTQKSNLLHNSWETAYKQLLIDQSNFLAAQAQAITNNNVPNPQFFTVNNADLVKDFRKEDEKKFEQRRIKLEENEKNFIQLAHQLKARSTQLENICKLAIEMRNDSFSATLQLAKLVNSGFRKNKLTKHPHYSTDNPDWFDAGIVRKTTKKSCSFKWKEIARRDRQSLDFEKLYLSVCKRK